MRHISKAGLLVAAAAVAATAGCGERREVTTGAGASPVKPASAPKASAAGTHGATLISASACLKRKGLPAQRAKGRDGLHLEVRGGRGTLSVYVFGSSAQALRKREAIAVGSKGSGGTVDQVGNAVTVTPAGTAADVSKKIRACLGA